MIRLLPLLLLLGCAPPAVDRTTRELIDEPLPELPILRDLPDHEGRAVLRVVNGHLIDLEGQLVRLRPGPQEFLVVNEVEGASVEDHGRDLRHGAIALWLRGRGSSLHRLPQASRGPVNAGVQEDWTVDLPPGDYLLSETLLRESTVIFSVR